MVRWQQPTAFSARSFTSRGLVGALIWTLGHAGGGELHVFHLGIEDVQRGAVRPARDRVKVVQAAS